MHVTAGASALSGAFYGAGSGSIFMDEVACTGTEARLPSCTHITNHNCGHGEDASVRCPLTQQASSTGYISYLKLITCDDMKLPTKQDLHANFLLH